MTLDARILAAKAMEEAEEEDEVEEEIVLGSETSCAFSNNYVSRVRLSEACSTVCALYYRITVYQDIFRILDISNL